MHPLFRCSGTALCVVLLLVGLLPLGAGESHIQFGMNREPIPVEVALTQDPAPNGTEGEFDPAETTTYLLGASGSGSHLIQCGSAEQPTGPFRHHIAWMSPQLFPRPAELNTSEPTVRLVQDVNVSFGVEPGSLEGAGALPAAVSAGPVEFELVVGYIAPGRAHHPHESWADTVELQPESPLPDLPAPLPMGPLPAAFSLDLPFSMDLTGIPGGSRIVFSLVISCANQAAFTLTFGAATPLAYVWGDPAWDDLDGDGVPDQWDDIPDGSGWTREEQARYNTNPLDPNDHPGMQSICEGYTIEEATDENPDFQREDASTCPGAGGFPWLLLLIALLLVLLLVGGAFGAMTAVNRKIRMEVSHDGFQDIPQGASAAYTLTLTAKGAEGDEVPAELSLKGVPEEWSAAVEPSNVLLRAGEDPEPVTATLTVTPPPDEAFEAEAVVTVTATPTDEDGKTSPMRPGTAVKTKTIVNIDKEPPEGAKKRRPKRGAAAGGEALAAEAASEAEPAEPVEESEEGTTKGRFGFLKRGKKAAEPEAESLEAAEGPPPEAGTGTQPAAAAAAAAAGEKKPDLAVGKMKHDPADFSEGDTVTTTVPVRNKGDAPVSGLMLRLYVNDERVDEKEIELEPGATAEVTFSWTAQPDENRVRVRGGLKEA